MYCLLRKTRGAVNLNGWTVTIFKDPNAKEWHFQDGRIEFPMLSSHRNLSESNHPLIKTHLWKWRNSGKKLEHWWREEAKTCWRGGTIMAESLLLQGHRLGWKKSVSCIEHYPGAQECTRLSNFLSRYSILSVCQLASCSSRYQATLWDHELQFCTTIWLTIMTSGSWQIQASGLSPRIQD